MEYPLITLRRHSRFRRRLLLFVCSALTSNLVGRPRSKDDEIERINLVFGEDLKVTEPGALESGVVAFLSYCSPPSFKAVQWLSLSFPELNHAVVDGLINCKVRCWGSCYCIA